MVEVHTRKVDSTGADPKVDCLGEVGDGQGVGGRHAQRAHKRAEEKGVDGCANCLVQDKLGGGVTLGQPWFRGLVVGLFRMDDWVWIGRECLLQIFLPMHPKERFWLDDTTSSSYAWTKQRENSVAGCIWSLTRESWVAY